MDTGRQQSDKKQLLQQKQFILQKQVQHTQLLKQHQQPQHQQSQHQQQQQQQQLKQQQLLQAQSQSQQPQQLSQTQSQIQQQLQTQPQFQQQLITQQQILRCKQIMQQEHLNKKQILQGHQKKQDQAILDIIQSHDTNADGKDRQFAQYPRPQLIQQQQQIHLQQQQRQQQDQHMQLQSLQQKHSQSSLQQPQFIQQHQILQQPEPQIVQTSLQQSPQFIQQSQLIKQPQVLQKAHLMQPQIIQQPYHVQQSPIMHQPQIVQKSQFVQQSQHIKQPQIIQQSQIVQQQNQYTNVSSQQQTTKQPPHTQQMLKQQLQQLMSNNKKSRIVLLNQPQQQQQFTQQPQRVHTANTSGQQQIISPQMQCVVVTGAGQQQPQQVPRMMLTGPGQQIQQLQQVVIPGPSQQTPQQIQNVLNQCSVQKQPQQKQLVMVSAASQQQQQPQLVVVNSNSQGQQKQQFIQQPQVQPVGQRFVIGQVKASQQTQQMQSSSQRGVILNQLHQPTAQRPITVKQQQQHIVIGNQQQLLKFPQQQSPQPMLLQQQLTQLSQPKQQQLKDVQQHKVTQQLPQNVVIGQPQHQKTNVKLSDQSLVQQLYVKQSHQQLQQFHIQPPQKQVQQNNQQQQLLHQKRLKPQQRHEKMEQQLELPLRGAVIIGQLQRAARPEPEKLQQQCQMQQEERLKAEENLKLQQNLHKKKQQHQKRIQENERKQKLHEQQLLENVLSQQNLKKTQQQLQQEILLTVKDSSENRTSFVISVGQNENQQNARESTNDCEKPLDHLQILAKDMPVNHQVFLQNDYNVSTDEDYLISSSSSDDDEDNEIVQKKRNLYYESERLVRERYKKLSVILGPKYQVHYDVILRNWLLGELSRDEYDREMRKVLYVSWALRSMATNDGKCNNDSLVFTTDANTVLTTKTSTGSTSDSMVTLTSKAIPGIESFIPNSKIRIATSNEKYPPILSIIKPMTDVTSIPLMNNSIEETDADIKIKEATAVLEERLPLHNELIMSLAAWLPHYLQRLERRSARARNVTETGCPLRLYTYIDTPQAHGYVNHWYPDVSGSLARWYWPNRLPCSPLWSNNNLELSFREQEQMEVASARVAAITLGPPPRADVPSVLRQYAMQKTKQYNRAIQAKQLGKYEKSYPIEFHIYETKWEQWQKLKTQKKLVSIILLRDEYAKQLRELKAHGRKLASSGRRLLKRLRQLQERMLRRRRQALAQFKIRLAEAQTRIHKTFDCSWQELPEDKARQQLLIKAATGIIIDDKTDKDDEGYEEDRKHSQLKPYSTSFSVRLLHDRQRYWASYRLLLAIRKKILKVQKNADRIRELRYKNCPCGVSERHVCIYQKEMYLMRKELKVCKEKVLYPSVNRKTDKKENMAAKKRKSQFNKNKLRGRKRKLVKIKNIVEENETLKTDIEETLLSGKNKNVIIDPDNGLSATVNISVNTTKTISGTTTNSTCSPLINSNKPKPTMHTESQTKGASLVKDITKHGKEVNCIPSLEKDLSSTRSNVLSDGVHQSFPSRKGQNNNVNVADAASRVAEAALAAFRKPQNQRGQEVDRRSSQFRPSGQVKKHQSMNGYMKLQGCLKELCNKHDMDQETYDKNQDDLGDWGRGRIVEERQQNEHYLYVGGSSYSSDDISESSIRPLSPLLHDLRQDQLLPIPSNRRWSLDSDQTQFLEPSPFIIHQNVESSVHKQDIEYKRNHEQYPSYLVNDHNKNNSEHNQRMSFEDAILNASFLTSLPGHSVCGTSDSVDRISSNKLPTNKIIKKHRNNFESREQQLKLKKQQQSNIHDEPHQNQQQSKKKQRLSDRDSVVELLPVTKKPRKTVGELSVTEKVNSRQKLQVSKESEQTELMEQRNQESSKNTSRSKQQSKRASRRKKSEHKDKIISTKEPQPLPELEIAEELQSVKWKAPLTQWNKRPAAFDENISMKYIEEEANTMKQQINEKIEGESEFKIESSFNKRIDFPKSNLYQNIEAEHLLGDRQQQIFSETDHKVQKLISEYQEVVANVPESQSYVKRLQLIQLLQSATSYVKMYYKSHNSSIIEFIEHQQLAVQLNKLQPSLRNSSEIILEQLRQVLSQFEQSQEDFCQLTMVANVDERKTNLTVDDQCINKGAAADDLRHWHDLWPAYEDKQNGEDNILIDEEQRLRLTQQIIDQYHSSKSISGQKSVPSLQQNQHLGLSKQERLELKQTEGRQSLKQNSKQLKSLNKLEIQKQQPLKQQQLEHKKKLLQEQKKKLNQKKQQGQHKLQEKQIPFLDERQDKKQKKYVCGEMQSSCLPKWKISTFVKSPLPDFYANHSLHDQMFIKFMLNKTKLLHKFQKAEKQPTPTRVEFKITSQCVIPDHILKEVQGIYKTHRGSTLWWSTIGFHWKISKLVQEGNVEFPSCYALTEPCSSSIRQFTLTETETKPAQIITRIKVRDNLTVTELVNLKNKIEPIAQKLWTKEENRCLKLLYYCIQNLTEEIKLHWDVIEKIQNVRIGLLLKNTEKIHQIEHKDKQQSHKSRTVDQEPLPCIQSAIINEELNVNTSGTVMTETENIDIHKKWHQLDALRQTHLIFWKTKRAQLYDWRHTKDLVNQHLYNVFLERFLGSNFKNDYVFTAIAFIPVKQLTSAERTKMTMMLKQLHASTVEQKKASLQKIRQKQVPKKNLKQHHSSEELQLQNKKNSNKPSKQQRLLQKSTKQRGISRKCNMPLLSNKIREMPSKKTQSKNKPKSQLKQKNQQIIQKQITPTPQMEALTNVLYLRNQLTQIEEQQHKRLWQQQQPEVFETELIYSKLTELQHQNIKCALRNTTYLLYQQWIILQKKLSALNVNVPEKQNESLISRRSSISFHHPSMNSVTLTSQFPSIMSVILKPHQRQLSDDSINPTDAVWKTNELDQLDPEMQEMYQHMNQQLGIVHSKLKPLMELWYLSNQLPKFGMQQQFDDLDQAIQDDLFVETLNYPSRMSGCQRLNKHQCNKWRTTATQNVTVHSLWRQFIRTRRYLIWRRRRIQKLINEYLAAIYREYLMTELPSTYSMLLKMQPSMSENKSGTMLLTLEKPWSSKEKLSVSSLTTTSQKILSSLQHSSTHLITLKLQDPLVSTKESLIYSTLLTLKQPLMPKQPVSMILTPYQQLTLKKQFSTPSMILTPQPSPSKRKLLMLLKKTQIITPKPMNSLVLATCNPTLNINKQPHGQVINIQQLPEKKQLCDGNKNNGDSKQVESTLTKISILPRNPVDSQQLQNVPSVYHPEMKKLPYIIDNENYVIEILDSDDNIPIESRPCSHKMMNVNEPSSSIVGRNTLPKTVSCNSLNIEPVKNCNQSIIPISNNKPKLVLLDSDESMKSLTNIKQTKSKAMKQTTESIFAEVPVAALRQTSIEEHCSSIINKFGNTKNIETKTNLIPNHWHQIDDPSSQKDSFMRSQRVVRTVFNDTLGFPIFTFRDLGFKNDTSEERAHSWFMNIILAIESAPLIESNISFQELQPLFKDLTTKPKCSKPMNGNNFDGHNIDSKNVSVSTNTSIPLSIVMNRIEKFESPLKIKNGCARISEFALKAAARNRKNRIPEFQTDTPTPPQTLRPSRSTETKFTPLIEKSVTNVVGSPVKRSVSATVTTNSITDREQLLTTKRSASVAFMTLPSTPITTTSMPSADKQHKRSKSALTATITDHNKGQQSDVRPIKSSASVKLGKRLASDTTTCVSSSTFPEFGSSKRYKSSMEGTMTSPPLTQHSTKTTTDPIQPTITPIIPTVAVNCETFENVAESKEVLSKPRPLFTKETLVNITNKINNDSSRTVSSIRDKTDDDQSNTNIAATKEEIRSVKVNRTSYATTPSLFEVTADACRMVVSACENVIRAVLIERWSKAGRGVGALELRRRDAFYAAVAVDEDIRPTPVYCRIAGTGNPMTKLDVYNDIKKLLVNQQQRRANATTVDELGNEKRIILDPLCCFTSKKCIFTKDESNQIKLLAIETVVETKITTTISTAYNHKCQTSTTVSKIEMQPSPSELEVEETSARTSGIIVQKTPRRFKLPKPCMATLNYQGIVNDQQPKTITIPSISKLPMTVKTPLTSNQSPTKESTFTITEITKIPSSMGIKIEEVTKTLSVVIPESNKTVNLVKNTKSNRGLYIERGRPLLRHAFQKCRPFGTIAATSILAAAETAKENNARHTYFNDCDDVGGQASDDIGSDDWNYLGDSGGLPPVSRLSSFTNDHNSAEASVSTKIDGLANSKTSTKIFSQTTGYKDYNVEEKRSIKHQRLVMLEIIRIQQQRKHLAQEMNRRVQEYQSRLPEPPEVLHQKFLKLQFGSKKALPEMPQVRQSLNINQRQGLVSW